MPSQVLYFMRGDALTILTGHALLHFDVFAALINVQL